MAINTRRIKNILFGEPFPTRAEIHERLDKVRALAIFASDPISSNAYATEAIMSVLILLGAGALRMTLFIGLAVMALVLLVVFSYTQTILHYPKGGGAYIVTKDNLGTLPSLFAAAALMIDYVLTVSVSVSAGVRAITSAIPSLFPHSVALALLAILLLTWINLRGVRESGTVFALPTYAFVVGVLAIVILGLVRITGIFGAAPPVLPQHTFEVAQSTGQITQFLYIWLILRAFAAGCTALTGIEAISDGVAAFKPPESKNAATTMIAMGIIAMSLFLGITFVATHIGLVPIEHESILSQMARAVTGNMPGGGFISGWVQLFTMLILVLAANTGFQDFPRVGSFLAADGFMPRWVQNRGDRLVYNSGIIMLAFLAAIIVVIFRANEIHMLPLYALGVMLGFTLSQISMVKLFNKIMKLKPGETAQTTVTTIHHEAHAKWKRLLPGFGSIVTGVVLVILIATKFMEGAWIVVVAIPLLVQLFRSIRKHYDMVAEGLSVRNFDSSQMRQYADVVIVPMADIHRGSLRALAYARQFSDNVRAISIITSPEQKERLQRRWDRFKDVTGDCELILIDYDYRDILTPLVNYIGDVTNKEFPGKLITVIVPEFIPGSFWASLLHNQTANILRIRLRGYEDVAVVDVPYHIRKHKSEPPTATQPTNEN